MKAHEWSKEKNEWLKKERNISFDDVIIAINEGNLITQTDHPNIKKYPGQKVYIIKINTYIYMVPFVEDTEKIFLKTVIPSRKATKRYL